MKTKRSSSSRLIQATVADGFLETEIPTRQRAVPIRKEMESYEVRKTGVLVSTDQLFILSVWTTCYKMFPSSGMGGGQANTSCAGLRGLLPSVGDKNHTDLSLHRTFAVRVVEKKINVSIRYNFQIGFFIFNCYFGEIFKSGVSGDILKVGDKPQCHLPWRFYQASHIGLTLAVLTTDIPIPFYEVTVTKSLWGKQGKNESL